MNKINWEPIKIEYEAGIKIVSAIAQDHNIAVSTLYRKAKIDNWNRTRRFFSTKCDAVIKLYFGKDDNEIYNKLREIADIERRTVSAQTMVAVEQFVYGWVG